MFKNVLENKHKEKKNRNYKKRSKWNFQNEHQKTLFWHKSLLDTIEKSEIEKKLKFI